MTRFGFAMGGLRRLQISQLLFIIFWNFFDLFTVILVYIHWYHLLLCCKEVFILKEQNDLDTELRSLGFKPYRETSEGRAAIRRKRFPIKARIAQLYDLSFLFTTFASVLIGGKHDSFEAEVLVIIYSVVGWAFLCKAVIQNGITIKNNLFPYIAYGVFIYVFAKMKPIYRQNFTAYYGSILLILFLVVSIDLTFKIFLEKRRIHS